MPEKGNLIGWKLTISLILPAKKPSGRWLVFSNGIENKDEYRLFKIKNAPPNDDMAALAEMIERRFKHPEWPFPDLDGHRRRPTASVGRVQSFARQ